MYIHNGQTMQVGAAVAQAVDGRAALPMHRSDCLTTPLAAYLTGRHLVHCLLLLLTMADCPLKATSYTDSGICSISSGVKRL